MTTTLLSEDQYSSPESVKWCDSVAGSCDVMETTDKLKMTSGQRTWWKPEVLSLSCLTADSVRHAGGVGGGGGSQKRAHTHTHTQETGSVIQYRPNHSSLPKSRLDGDPTLWGENKTEPNTKEKRWIRRHVWRKV